MVQLAGAVIGALGTSVGILAIVAHFGGLKMLARLRAAGLPGTEGVANIPRGLLVAVGADELIPVVLFATAAALAVWMAGPRRHTTRASTSTAPDRTPQMAAVTASVATGGAGIACAFYIFLAGIGEVDRNAVLMIAVFALLGSASAWLAHQHEHSIAPPALVFTTVSSSEDSCRTGPTSRIQNSVPPRCSADGSVLAGAWIARNDDWFFLGRLSAEEGRDDA
jgi:hypothetical protein